MSCGQVQQPTVPVCPVELDQRRFDFRVAFDQGGLRRPQHIHEHRSEPVGHRGEAGGTARSPGVGHGRLEQVPGAIKLVAHGRVAEPPTFLHHLHVGIDVTVGILRGRDQFDAGSEKLFLLGVSAVGAFPGDGFEDFVEVRVPENGEAVLGRGPPGRDAKVLEGPAGFQHADPVRDGDLTVLPLAVTPEPGAQFDRSGAYRLDGQQFL